jgi:hypothetical protein
MQPHRRFWRIPVYGLSRKKNDPENRPVPHLLRMRQAGKKSFRAIDAAGGRQHRGSPHKAGSLSRKTLGTIAPGEARKTSIIKGTIMFIPVGNNARTATQLAMQDRVAANTPTIGEQVCQQFQRQQAEAAAAGQQWTPKIEDLTSPSRAGSWTAFDAQNAQANGQ